VGRTLDGRYRIRAHLGSGGVGAVYEGEHVEIKKQVAVKVLHALFASTEEFRRRFEREARSASRLSHPACVTVLDFGRVARVEPDAPELHGTPYLVMEFVRGRSLHDRLANGPLEAAEAVATARGVLGALKHAHGLGIVHRDVKPANIMLLDEEVGGARVKLLDFGLAKDSMFEGEALTQAGMVFGTPSYLSPEQAAGGRVDARSDLYSLGVVLFEMVCGRRPFERNDPLDYVRDHMNTPPPPPRSFAPAISAELEAVILRALEKKPEVRHASADELLAALAGCPEAGGAARPAEVSAPAPARRPAALPAWLRPAALLAWLRPAALLAWLRPAGTRPGWLRPAALAAITPTKRSAWRAPRSAGMRTTAARTRCWAPPTSASCGAPTRSKSWRRRCMTMRTSGPMRA
jgi:serine/threonine-protein kinase